MVRMVSDIADTVRAELERAQPAPVTHRSIRSFVTREGHSREALDAAVSELLEAGEIEKVVESGFVRYRLAGELRD